jgi:hypothetical protein
MVQRAGCPRRAFVQTFLVFGGVTFGFGGVTFGAGGTVAAITTAVSAELLVDVTYPVAVPVTLTESVTPMSDVTIV